MRSQYCDHKELEHVFDVPFDVKSGRKTDFGSLHRCSRCGIRMVHPIPDASEVPLHYDLPAYYTHGVSHLAETEPTLLQRAIAHLAWRTDRGRPFDPKVEFDPHSSSKMVLDIGCGAGTLLSKFSDIGFETFGVDPDERALAAAQEKGHKVFQGTAEDLPAEISNQRFEAISMTHVLEHCLDPARALENASSLLSEDGIFYCEVPNAGSIYFQTYGQISEMLDVPRHLFFFRKDDLENLATSVGLTIIGWRFHGLTRHFTAGWKKWENSIYDRLIDAGVQPDCSRRSIAGDLKLLAKGAFRKSEFRYDCIGFLARRAPQEPSPRR